MLAVTATSTAGAHKLPSRYPGHMLTRIHHQRDMTWKYQTLTGNATTTYRYWAERRCESKECRYTILKKWHTRHHRWQYLYKHIGTAVSSGPNVPSWAISFFNCISSYEEYGVDGGNTSAGYFGFVYPPSSYVEPGPTYASQYGDSWLSIPLSAQYEVAYALYEAFGTSPWSTSYHCT